MRYPEMVARLGQGETIQVRVHGNSMTPRIRSGQRLTVRPLDLTAEKVSPGAIVLAKVRGHYYFHLVTAVRGKEYQISNNKGHVNGFTQQIYGLVIGVD